MESFIQEHVVGIPLVSIAYADEETEGTPSCSALIRKKSKNLTTFFPSSPCPFAITLRCMPILIWYSLHYTDKKSSFIGWANWARKKITTCKGSKNTVKIQPLSFFHKWKFCHIDKIKFSSLIQSFFLCSISGTKNFRIYQRETKLRCKGSPSWWYWQSLQRILCSQERWETSESIPMLSFNHSRSNSWNAFHLNWENCFPQW